jgi:hypothetical protein
VSGGIGRGSPRNTLPEAGDMIYFFLKNGEYAQCEIYPGRPHVLTYIDATGTSQIERFHNGDDLEAR